MPEPTSKSFDEYLDSLTPPEPADEGFSLKKLAKLGLTTGIRTGGAVLGAEGGFTGAGINGVADYLAQAVDLGTLNPMEMNKAQLAASSALGAVPGGALFKMVKGAPAKAVGMGLGQGLLSTELTKAAQDDPNNTNPQGIDAILHPKGKVGLTSPASWSPLEQAGALLPAVLGGVFAGRRTPVNPAAAAQKAEGIAAANAAQKVKETQFGTVYQSKKEAEELADLLGKHNRPATVVPTDKGYKLVPSDLEAQTPEFEGKVPVATKLTERNGKRTVAKVYGSPEEAARAAEASQDKMWDNTTKDLNAAEKNRAATTERLRKAQLGQQAMAGKVKTGQKVVVTNGEPRVTETYGTPSEAELQAARSANDEWRVGKTTADREGEAARMEDILAAREGKVRKDSLSESSQAVDPQGNIVRRSSMWVEPAPKKTEAGVQAVDEALSGLTGRKPGLRVNIPGITDREPAAAAAPARTMKPVGLKAPRKPKTPQEFEAAVQAALPPETVVTPTPATEVVPTAPVASAKAIPKQVAPKVTPKVVVPPVEVAPAVPDVAIPAPPKLTKSATEGPVIVKQGARAAQPPSLKVIQESIDGLERQLQDPEMVSYHPTINRRLQLLKDEAAKLVPSADVPPVAASPTTVTEAAPTLTKGQRKVVTGPRSGTIPKGGVSARMAELEGQLGEMEPPFPPNQKASPQLQALQQRWEKLSKLYKTNQQAYKAGEGEGVDAAASGRMLSEFAKANKDTITKMADAETLNLPENVAAIRDIAKQMGLKIAKTAPLEKVLDAIEKKGGPAGLIANQSGEMDPMLAARLGTAALGGVVGSTQDEEHPIRGALIGAGLGAAAPSLIQKGMGAFEHPGALTGALKSKVEQAVKLAPDVQRFNLLSRPVNLASNTIVGPWGSAFWKGLEHKMVNDPRGDEMLSNVFSTQFPKRLVQAFKSGEAADAIGAAERAEKSVGEAVSPIEEFLAKPGEAMTAGDQASRHLGEVSGFTPAEMRTATMTNEPSGIIGAKLNNMFKTKLPDGKGGYIDSTLTKLMLPFKRTSANIIDRGIERTPGIGALYQRYGKAEADRDSGGMQLVQQGLGGGVYTASYLAGSRMDPKDPNVYRYRKIMADAAGPYSMLASAGFMAGLAKARGKSGMSPHLTGVSTAFGDMPLPTTRTPMELAKFGAGVLSGQALSKPLHPKSKGLAKYLPHGFYPGVLADVDEDTVKSIGDFFK